MTKVTWREDWNVKYTCIRIFAVNVVNGDAEIAGLENEGTENEGPSVGGGKRGNRIVNAMEADHK